MPVAFKEDDVLAVTIPGVTVQSPDELCSISYDDSGRIVLIVNQTSGVKEFRTYHSDDYGIISYVKSTFFDIENNYLTCDEARVTV